MPISIEKRQLNTAQDLFLGIDFPTNAGFRRLMYWVSVKIDIPFIILCRLTGSPDQMNADDKVINQDTDLSFLIDKHTSKERAYLLVLLLVLGYERKEIFNDFLVADYWFRHKEFVAEKKTEINKAQKKLKHHLLYGSLRLYVMRQDGKTIEQSIAEFQATNPALKGSIIHIRTTLKRKYPYINPVLLRINNRRFGLLKPSISTAHKNKHRCLMVDSKCIGCGSVRPYHATHLIRGIVRACPACKNKQRQKVVMVVNALTGRRYTSISKAHKGEGITSIALRSLEVKFKVSRAVRVDGCVLIRMSPSTLSRKEYQKFLPDAGLPVDFVIPPDPDKQEKSRQRCLKMIATKRRRAQSVRHQQIKAKRKERKRQNATLATQASGYWSLNNLAEYRIKRMEEGERIKQKVIEEDEFLLTGYQKSANDG